MRRALLLWLLLFAVYSATVGLDASPGERWSAREGHVLLTAESIVSDGDLDLRDQYREGAWTAYGGPPLRPTAGTVEGRLLEPQGIGFPLLIAPAYALGGTTLVQLVAGGADGAGLRLRGGARAAARAGAVGDDRGADRGALAADGGGRDARLARGGRRSGAGRRRPRRPARARATRAAAGGRRGRADRDAAVAGDVAGAGRRDLRGRPRALAEPPPSALRGVHRRGGGPLLRHPVHHADRPAVRRADAVRAVAGGGRRAGRELRRRRARALAAARRVVAGPRRRDAALGPVRRARRSWRCGCCGARDATGWP